MKRRKHTKEFKFKVAIEAIRGDMTIAQMVSKYQVSDGLIHKWRRQLLDQGVVSRVDACGAPCLAGVGFVGTGFVRGAAFWVCGGAAGG